MMLALHSVLVTLDGPFTISIEQIQIEMVTPNTIFRLVTFGTSSRYMCAL